MIRSKSLKNNFHAHSLQSMVNHGINACNILSTASVSLWRIYGKLAGEKNEGKINSDIKNKRKMYTSGIRNHYVS